MNLIEEKNSWSWKPKQNSKDRNRFQCRKERRDSTCRYRLKLQTEVRTNEEKYIN